MWRSGRNSASTRIRKQGSVYPTVGMNEVELLRDIVTFVSSGPQRTRELELESKFHFDLSNSHLADFQYICDDEQPLSEANKNSGKMQGDGQKFLDRFKGYFWSQISSQSLNEVHIYRSQPKSATKGEFLKYVFVFDCFKSASRIANGERSRRSAAR